jgi:hypothetical protein
MNTDDLVRSPAASDEANDEQAGHPPKHLYMFPHSAPACSVATVPR